MKYGHGSLAYRINLEKQDKTIIKMNTFIEEMRVGRKTILLPFQKGILICNKSLQKIFTYIKYSSEEFEIKYLPDDWIKILKISPRI